MSLPVYSCAPQTIWKQSIHQKTLSFCLLYLSSNTLETSPGGGAAYVTTAESKLKPGEIKEILLHLFQELFESIPRVIKFGTI
jgi:hypothetical protein